MLNLKWWQEKYINSESDMVIGNWSRGAGKTFTLGYLILKNKPQTVLYISNLQRIGEVIHDITRMESDIKEEIKSLSISKDVIKIVYNDGLKTEITRVLIGSLGNDKLYDLVIYDNELPTLAFKGKKIYSMVSKNNINRNIEKEFPNAYVQNIDVFYAIEEGLVSKEKLNICKTGYKYYDEFELLTNPYNEQFDTKAFKNNTLSELQQEYNNTPKNKDTILTRKNIIETITMVNKMS